MPIRVRLALLFAAGAAFVIATGGTVFMHLFAAGLVGSLDTALLSQVPVAAQAVPDASGQDNFQDSGGQVFGNSGSVEADQAGEYLVQVVSPTGAITESSQAAGRKPLVGPGVLADGRRDDQYLTARRPGSTEPVRLLVAPVTSRPGWVVVVGASLETTNEAVARVRRALIAGGIGAVVVGGLGAFFLATAALRPVERMRRQAAAMSDQDHSAALEVPTTRDEVASLARTMNDLLARLHSSMAALHASIQRQRAFVSDAGHELRTPLSVLRAELELAGRPGRSPGQLRSAVAAAAEETDRLARLAEDLLLLARHDEHRFVVDAERTNIADVLSRSAGLAEGRAGQRSVRLQVVAPPELAAWVDPARLRQAVDNLVDNAVRFAPEHTDVELSARANGSSELIIEVADHGPGFPEAFLPNAFERFSRPDDARSRVGGGTGLGLAIVAAIAEAHDGRAEASNRDGGGAVVRIVLPERLVDSAAVAAPASPPQDDTVVTET